MRIVALLVSTWFAGVSHAAPPMVVAGSTTELAGPAYLIPDRNVALVPNIGIIVGDESVLVVDTGMGPRNAETVLAEVREITELPIRYLVSTHFHPEHNFGAQVFSDETILIYAATQYQDLQEKGELYRSWFVEMFRDDVSTLLEPVVFVRPDVTFARTARFDLGGVPVELHHFGEAAHTRGDTIIYLPEQRLIFTGGLTPNGSFPILPDEDSSVRGWLVTLDALDELEIDILVPGHGDVADSRLINSLRIYFASLRAECLRLIEAGVGVEEAKKVLVPQFTERYSNWRDPSWLEQTVEIIYSEAGAAQ